MMTNLTFIEIISLMLMLAMPYILCWIIRVLKHLLQCWLISMNAGSVSRVSCCFNGYAIISLVNNRLMQVWNSANDSIFESCFRIWSICCCSLEYSARIKNKTACCKSCWKSHLARIIPRTSLSHQPGDISLKIQYPPSLSLSLSLLF